MRSIIHSHIRFVNCVKGLKLGSKLLSISVSADKNLRIQDLWESKIVSDNLDFGTVVNHAARLITLRRPIFFGAIFD